MQVYESAPDGVLWLKAGEKALVKRPDAASILGLLRPDTALVVVDMEGVEFVSSLFLEGCVNLAGALAAQGRELVMLHMAQSQSRLLEMVDGGARIPVLDGAGQLIGRPEAARTRPPGADQGVTRAEKSVLWG
jgi:hypothetical protein